MAHYTFLDMANVVTEVIVGRDEGDTNTNWEIHYGNFREQVCKRTSYNTKGGVYYDPTTGEPGADQSKAFRKNYAGIGYTYDHSRDAFIPPKPFDSWVLDEQSCLWEAPVAYPDDGQMYTWNEEMGTWDLITE